MNTVVFSVIYPGVEQYLRDFISSLLKQTDKDFTLFLINDGCLNIDLLLERIDIPIKVLQQKGQPAAIRKIGIKWVVSEGAESIIFADADDYFAENRIEISKKLMFKHDIVCNELLLTGQEYPQPVPMLGKYFEDGAEITQEDIIRGNCLGLSNAAITVDKICKLAAEIPDDIIAFDWAFFTLSLHGGAEAIFTKKTQTYYRQHGENIASPCSFSVSQILRGVRIKRDHYNFLSQYYYEYTNLSKVYQSLYTKLQSDVLLKEEYCKAMRMNATEISIWWEPIKTLEELGL
jgi:glycosyltransferase involved in cell wall biosynthesis